MKKKLLLIVSMLAVAFTLAGCGPEKKKVEFEYDKNELATYVQEKSEEFMSYLEYDEFYNYIVSAGTDTGLSETDVEAVKVFAGLEDECGEFEEFTGDYEIEEKDDTVIVSIYAKCSDEEARIKAIFEDNLDYYNFQVKYYQLQGGSDDEIKSTLAANGIYPYKITEYEVSANQSFKAKMKAAGVNTIIGMGIVFCALIFISFIISLLKFVPMLLDKETRAARKAEKAKKAQEAAGDNSSDEAASVSTPAGAIVDIVDTNTGASVMNDTELVAVIAAAITASAGQTYVNYPSNDKLVARKIRRIKR